MRLKLFDLIEEAVGELEVQHDKLEETKNILVNFFHDGLVQYEELYVGINSRIKGSNSLKEKIIRNKLYNNCENGVEIVNILSDLIGINIECRFISDEAKCLDIVKHLFEMDGHEFSKAINNDHIYLNLRMPQPQVQRNGFTIFRVDGYYDYDGHRFNFELQIKSLIHNFWSEVEHQVVYKNTSLVYYDHFMQNILGSIRDNLDVVDNQLQVVFKQIKDQSFSSDDIGMSEDGFKMFMAKSINDLYSVKMVESVGFTSNFKQCSAILAQYIYIKDFLQSSFTQVKMVEYFEQFNLLKNSDLTFTEPIELEREFYHYCPFINILGKYWESIMNNDFEWHSFFVMLFAIESGNNIQDFTNFIKVIRDLIVTPSWFNSKFSQFSAKDAKIVRDRLLESLALEMVDHKKIDMIFENKLFAIMKTFHQTVEEIDSSFTDFDKLNEFIDDVMDTFRRKIRLVLKKKEK